MNLEIKTLAFELKASGEGDAGNYTFEGLAGVFNNLDWKGDIIDPAAFDLDIEFTRKSGKVRDEHGVTTGRLAAADVRRDGLFVKGLILPTAAGKDQTILVKGGAVDRLSVGFTTLAREFLNSPDEVKSYWQQKGYTPTEDDMLALGQFRGARLLKRAKVYEVSTTWLPVNTRARITGKGAGQLAGRTFAEHSETVLAAVGEYLERAEAISAKRSESGRTLAPEAKSRLTQLKGRLDSLLSSLETKAADPAPEQTPDAAALYAQTLATFARLDGRL